MKTLATLCRSRFGDAVRQRGESYLNSGHVAIRDASGDRLMATVEGRGGDYDVVVDWSDGPSRQVLGVDCTCPHFDDGNLCKHVWATILARDELYGPLDVRSQSWIVVERHELRNARPQTTGKPAQANRRPRVARTPAWRECLNRVLSLEGIGSRRSGVAAADTAIYYVVDVESSQVSGGLQIDLFDRRRKANGELGAPRPIELTIDDLEELPDETDRETLLALFANLEFDSGPSYFGDSNEHLPPLALVPRLMYEYLLPKLAATRRLVADLSDESQPDAGWTPIDWRDGPSSRVRVAVEETGDKGAWRVRTWIESGAERREITDVRFVIPGLALCGGTLWPLEPSETWRWAAALSSSGDVAIPAREQTAFVQAVLALPGAEEIELPESHRFTTARPAPRPHLALTRDNDRGRSKPRLIAQVSFDYDGQVVPYEDPRQNLVDFENRTIVVRDMEQEDSAVDSLGPLGFIPERSYGYDDEHITLDPRKLNDVVATLAPLGWLIEADASVMRVGGQFRMSVSSGVDWFDVDAGIDFDGQTATLPDLLAALRRGERFVRLGDGSQGMLPDEWLRRYGPLAEMGEIEGDRVRFRRSQALVLDALLAADNAPQVDAVFERLRTKLRTFAGVRPATAPAGFQGELRGYQHEGLGWLEALADLGLGGCLADDMGLGKTIQVLALLERRRARRLKVDERRRPSLVVVPRSLVHNWIDEAARFCPKLRFVDYSGLDRRQRLADAGADYDVLLTTYGTLRRDIADLRETRFDYAILDESQAIKNSGSQSAKACRLIQCDHRLAMTGTPVENHLGELWSLFEFLNPGMLGASERFRSLAGSGGESLESVAQAVRPFLLRRTKEQVLSELPPKTEQTLFCELEGPQRRLYNELRDHYRAIVGKKVQADGMKKAKFQVLEALLRLRQAACHPGLLSEQHAKTSSAKFDALWEQLQEVLAERHKALVFSQFTSLLGLLRKRLDAARVDYEYLDGRTRNRKEKVERFEKDADCRLFLISLKAGGVGLNLTAADYVFILDPWWNPAVEAQAVDRAHRIGQSQRVFAYRLIARDTVEEKILELQQGKRRLADAIIGQDESVLSKLTAEDLQLLLS